MPGTISETKDLASSSESSNHKSFLQAACSQAGFKTKPLGDLTTKEQSQLRKIWKTSCNVGRDTAIRNGHTEGRALKQVNREIKEVPGTQGVKELVIGGPIPGYSKFQCLRTIAETAPSL